MCPRFVWAKVRPGDLVWCLLEDGTLLYHDSEAGANPDAQEASGSVEHKTPCLVLALQDTVILVLAPNGRYGWTHRIFWERVGEVEQEYEHLGSNTPVEDDLPT